MENPFKKLIESNKKEQANFEKIKRLDKNFTSKFYQFHTGTIVFIERHQDKSNCTLVWRTSEGATIAPAELIIDEFKHITLQGLKKHKEFNKDLKFIIENDAYNTFLEQFKINDEYEAIIYIEECVKKIFNDEF